MGRKMGYAALDDICKKALKMGMEFHLRSLRKLINEPSGFEQMTFFDSHPLIRDPSEYASVVEGSK